MRTLHIFAYSDEDGERAFIGTSKEAAIEDMLYSEEGIDVPEESEKMLRKLRPGQEWCENETGMCACVKYVILTVHPDKSAPEFGHIVAI